MDRDEALARLANLLPGGELWCPVCDARPRRFGDWSEAYLGAVCPRCLCHPRHRGLWLYFEKQLGSDGVPRRMLDVAPHPALRQRLSRLGVERYVTADLVRRNVHVRLDLTLMPFPAGTFDVVLCSHVLEHIENEAAALYELRRITAPGGWAWVQVCFDPSRQSTLEDPAIRTPEARTSHYLQHDHVRLYGWDFPERLRAAGFDPDTVDLPGMLGAELLARCGIHYRGDEVLFLGRVPA